MRNPYISNCAENHGTLQDLNYVAPILSGGNLLCRNPPVGDKESLVRCTIYRAETKPRQKNRQLGIASMTFISAEVEYT